MNNLSIEHEGRRSDVDDLLHDYFQSEMPKPWPALRVPHAPRPRRIVSVWSRYAGRLALAACIALLAGGYLTLSGYFPHQQDGHGVEATHTIGLKEKRTQKPAVPKHQGGAENFLEPMGVQSSGK